MTDRETLPVERRRGFAKWWRFWGDTARFWRAKSIAIAAYRDGFEHGVRASKDQTQ